MKLIPKAKPVKIRIKSGGEEHSSLDSLKRNFNISDIQPLLDGRLVRWLKQQGDNELAEIVNNFKPSSLHTPNGVMEFMQVFFAEYLQLYNIDNVFKLIVSWLNASSFRNNGKHLLCYITKSSNNPESINIIKQLYKHKKELKCPELDWYAIFSALHKNYTKEDPEVTYILGTILYQDDAHIEYYSYRERKKLGSELIDKAARLGNKEAYQIIMEINESIKKETINKFDVIEAEKDKKTNIRFNNVDIKKLKSWIDKAWDNNFRSYNIIQPTNKDNMDNREMRIIKFITRIYRIGWISEHLGFQKALDEALEMFKNDKYDILNNEKQFVIGLIYTHISDRTRAEAIFTEIKDYRLANYMLYKVQTIDGVDFRRIPFQHQLTFIKDHLFDYE